MSRHYENWLSSASFMSKMPKMPYLMPMPSDKYHIIYGNMGVKRCVRTSGMKTNLIKILVHRFKGLKCQNTDFRNFPLYVFKFPFVSGKGVAAPEKSLKTNEFFFESVLGIDTAVCQIP